MDIKCKIDNIKYKEWETWEKTLNNIKNFYGKTKYLTDETSQHGDRSQR